MSQTSTPERAKESVGSRIQSHLKTLLFANRYGYQQVFRDRFIAKACAEMKAQEPELFALIGRSLRSLKLDPEKPHKKHGDGWLLFRAVMDRRPRTILELGSGMSTAVFAFALKRLHGEADGVKVVSMEENQGYWTDMVLPEIGDLAPWVESRISPVRSALYSANGVTLLGCAYRDLPLEPFDFVFTDGPVFSKAEAVRRAGGRPVAPGSQVFGKAFNSDVLDLMAGTGKPVDVLVDQRLNTIEAWRRLSAGKAVGTYHYGAMKTQLSLRPEMFSGIQREDLVQA